MGFYELAEKTFELEKSGKSLIKLNIGDSNLPTPECAVEAAIKSIKKSKSSYGPAAGIIEFREMIAEREGCEPEEVVVGSGSKSIIFALLSVLCRNGDGVSVPTPAWPAYGLIGKQLGLEMKFQETKLENQWNFEPQRLLESKVAIICNPLNPTSTVYPEKIMRELLNTAEAKGMHVILDEAYKELAFEKIPRYENAIRVRSFSKEFNMEGWRLGYAIAPKEIIKKMVSFNQITATCTPEFIQRAGMFCLENEKEIIYENMKVWKPRIETASNALKEAGFEFATPQAGIYIFATTPKIRDSDEYVMKLLDHGVAVAPGSGFGTHKQFIRICVNQSEEKLKLAAKLMKEALHDMSKKK